MKILGTSIFEDNQYKETTCLFIESGIILSLFLCPIVLIYIAFYGKGPDLKVYLVYLIFLLSLSLVGVICQSIFLGRIIQYSSSYYCSDIITNEIIRMNNEDTEKTIIYIVINLTADIFYILLNFIPLLFCLINKIKSDFYVIKRDDYSYNYNRKRFNI